MKVLLIFPLFIVIVVIAFAAMIFQDEYAKKDLGQEYVGKYFRVKNDGTLNIYATPANNKDISYPLEDGEVIKILSGKYGQHIDSSEVTYQIERICEGSERYSIQLHPLKIRKHEVFGVSLMEVSQSEAMRRCER